MNTFGPFDSSGRHEAVSIIEDAFCGYENCDLSLTVELLGAVNQGGTPVTCRSANSLMHEFEEVSVFTTGQVARICQVAPRTVSKWFDTGRLHGYRIPGSQDRRIPRHDLVEFMQSHGMPLGVLAAAGPSRVLLVNVDSSLERQLMTDFPREVTLQLATSSFEAGSLTTHWKPHGIALDMTQTPTEYGAMAIGMRRVLGREVAIVAIVGQEALPAEVLDVLDETFRVPVDSPLVAARIQKLAAQAALKVR